jgi:CRISPR-associated RAMP protein (TIGR02581 family)
MLKATLNELQVHLDLEVVGPLLVKARDWEDEEKEAYRKEHEQDPPNMVWVRLFHRKGNPFIPGSSIKGVLRSHAEKLARASAFPNFGCCNPFLEVKEALTTTDGWEASCSDKFRQLEQQGERIDGARAYRNACPICKLFGCSKLASRLRIDDAHLKGDQEYLLLERRDGVAIDRFTGGAKAGAKYNVEVMVGGMFATSLYLRNFERWQAGLLACLLQDLMDELLRFGYGKRRGFGKVKGIVREIKLTYFGFVPQGCTKANPIVAGIGSLTQGWGNEWSQYGFHDTDAVPLQPIEGALRCSFSLPTDFNQSPWIELVKCWDDLISNYRLLEEMERSRFEGVLADV